MNKKDTLNFQDFEKSLEEQKSRLRSNIQSIQEEVTMLAMEDNIDDIEDMAELQIQNVRDQKLIAHLESELVEVEAALNRIKDGTYGICEKTGKKIPLQRLMANPTARTITP